VQLLSRARQLDSPPRALASKPSPLALCWRAQFDVSFRLASSPSSLFGRHRLQSSTRLYHSPTALVAVLFEYPSPGKLERRSLFPSAFICLGSLQLRPSFSHRQSHLTVSDHRPTAHAYSPAVPYSPCHHRQTLSGQPGELSRRPASFGELTATPTMIQRR
jgi:hypothetical protein